MKTDREPDILAGAEYDIMEINNIQSFEHNVQNQMESHVIDKFETHVANQPKKPFIVYDGAVHTYEAVDNMACRVASVARSWGLKSRDCVAVVIENEPSFVWLFYGFQKLGISVAFVNHNLRSHPLLHSITSVDCKALIVGSGNHLLKAVADIKPQLGKLSVFVQGLSQKELPDGIASFDALMNNAYPVEVSPVVRADQTLEDTCCYIYTSGTTGKPKPVIFSHAKAIGMGAICQHLSGILSQDILYCVLPLYHNTGCFLAQGAVMLAGATMVLRKRFSAREFWNDCRRYKVTLIPYIGELLRYLLSEPKNEMDGVNNVRLLYGAGFRADIWKEFMDRFKIPKVVELYGATEGYTLFVNYAGKRGSVGRLSPLLRKFDSHHKVLVKYDISTAIPLRDDKGRCIPVKVGEPGLFLSKVPEHLVNKKLYKASLEANEKKFVRNAFVDGDVYMNYGDSLYQDNEYYVYFHDRLGDTFRWKGENVSTKEVADAISILPFIEDANVYGVEIPGKDGKAGMAALTLIQGKCLDNKQLNGLYQHVCKELPSYARPVLLRLLPEALLTGTFKNKKVDLANEGFDLTKVKDPIYFLDHANKTYSLLKKENCAALLKAKL